MQLRPPDLITFSDTETLANYHTAKPYSGVMVRMDSLAVSYPKSSHQVAIHVMF